MNGTIDRRLRRLETKTPMAADDRPFRVCFMNRPGHPDPSPEEIEACTMVVRFVSPDPQRA